MSDLLAVVLICASTIPQSGCDRTTAEDVMTMPAATPFECLSRGQSIVAGGSLREALQANTYLKVVCERRGIATAKLAPVRDQERP
jgi:hypothetical protein